MKKELREVLDAASKRVAERPDYLLSPDVKTELERLRKERAERISEDDARAALEPLLRDEQERRLHTAAVRALAALRGDSGDRVVDELLRRDARTVRDVARIKAALRGATAMREEDAKVADDRERTHREEAMAHKVAHQFKDGYVALVEADEARKLAHTIRALPMPTRKP